MARRFMKSLAVLAAPFLFTGCLSLAIGDNSSRRHAECKSCGRDLDHRLCDACQKANWDSACADCAKLGEGHMCPKCQEK